MWLYLPPLRVMEQPESVAAFAEISKYLFNMLEALNNSILKTRPNNNTIKAISMNFPNSIYKIACLLALN